eukprot:TRINITY_DN831_c0_g1_i1.p2 TRINITY_DN831_c0_g1~~TRINITY_DN831_c0_g1_i1.p2  ORF type:complete len:368 (-),score=50.82 TRINITY_DN831_c0_g1_i1:2431-3534(-)
MQEWLGRWMSRLSPICSHRFYAALYSSQRQTCTPYFSSRGMSSRSKSVKYYAVAKGRLTGIYPSWEECEKQVTGYSGAIYKSFPSLVAAQSFLDQHNAAPSPMRSGGAPASQSRSTATDQTDDNLHSQLRASLPLASMEDEVVPPSKRRKTLDHHQQQQPSPAANGYLAATSQPPAPLNVAAAAASSAVPSLSGYRQALNGERYWVAYTDGACPGNGKINAIAGVGAVLFDPTGKQTMELSEPLPASSRQTNQRAEIYAVIRLLEQADERISLEIRTDSNYVVQAMTSWRIGWQKKNWQVPLENKDLFQYLIYLCSRRAPIQWTHVRGHVGEPGNEIADQLAVKGAAMKAADDFKFKYIIPSGHFTN